ncbi:MAG: hypothetical protein KC656_26225, partial [Myxococcales bacterium]|nr:hypothetical protein [Myxococcales bacterium]
MLVLLLGCPHPIPVPAPVADPPMVDVDVAFDREMDTWTVRYTTSEPASGLWFVRDRHRFRASGWAVEGGAFSEAGYGEVVLGEGPWTVRFPTDTANREKDYKLHLGFTDGSRLLYTGHLAVHPLVPAPDGVQRYPDDVTTRWTFRAAGQTIAILDQVGQDALVTDIDQLARQGAYVYVGSIEPLRTERMTAFLDPGMPEWLRERTLSRLDGLFTTFGTWTGHPLDFHPVIFASASSEGTGRNLKGGTLPGQMQLAADGPGWATPSDAADQQWYRF